MAFEVTPAQRAALEAACETLIPALQAPEGGDKAYWAATPADFNVPQQILDLMEAQSPAEQQEFRQLLGLLDSKIAGLWFGGSWAKFREMPLERRGEYQEMEEVSRSKICRDVRMKGDQTHPVDQVSRSKIFRDVRMKGDQSHPMEEVSRSKICRDDRMKGDQTHPMEHFSRSKICHEDRMKVDQTHQIQ